MCPAVPDGILAFGLAGFLAHAHFGLQEWTISGTCRSEQPLAELVGLLHQEGNSASAGPHHPAGLPTLEPHLLEAPERALSTSAPFPSITGGSAVSEPEAGASEAEAKADEPEAEAGAAEVEAEAEAEYMAAVQSEPGSVREAEPKFAAMCEGGVSYRPTGKSTHLPALAKPAYSSQYIRCNNVVLTLCCWWRGDVQVCRVALMGASGQGGDPSDETKLPRGLSTGSMTA